MVRIIWRCNGKRARHHRLSPTARTRIVAGFDINTERHAISFTRTRQTVRLKRTIIDFRTPARLTAYCPARTSTSADVIATPAFDEQVEEIISFQRAFLAICQSALVF